MLKPSTSHHHHSFPCCCSKIAQVKLCPWTSGALSGKNSTRMLCAGTRCTWTALAQSFAALPHRAPSAQSAKQRGCGAEVAQAKTAPLSPWLTCVCIGVFVWPAQKIRKKAQVHVAFLVAGAACRNGSGRQRRKTTTQWARRKAAGLRC